MWWRKKRILVDGDVIKVVHAGLLGQEIISWTIGDDIDLDCIEDLFDYRRDCLYAMTHVENGEAHVTALSRKGWDLLQSKLREIQ